MVATRARSGLIARRRRGWTLLDSSTTYVFVTGSIQREVPVKPVWPNEPTGKSSPRFEEKGESMSKPRPRRMG